MDDISPILVVDDEMLVRLALTEALEEGGYSVIEAADGDAALEQIEQADRLRGLVTDIRMPGPSGWEIAHRARGGRGPDDRADQRGTAGSDLRGAAAAELIGPAVGRNGVDACSCTCQ